MSRIRRPAPLSRFQGCFGQSSLSNRSDRSRREQMKASSNRSMRFGNEYGKHGGFRDQLLAVVQSVRAPISLRSIRRDEPAAPPLQRRQRLHLSGCFACANRLERLLIRPKGVPNRRDRIQLLQEFRTRSFMHPGERCRRFVAGLRRGWPSEV